MSVEAACNQENGARDKTEREDSSECDRDPGTRNVMEIEVDRSPHVHEERQHNGRGSLEQCEQRGQQGFSAGRALDGAAHGTDPRLPLTSDLAFYLREPSGDRVERMHHPT